jgi:uridine monophosphate synthetase
MSFFAALTARCRAVDSLLCIGLDPHSEELAGFSTPAEGAALAEAFCLRLIAETQDVACAFKPNAAFFEAFGSEGVAALQRVIRAIPSDIPCILDCKRGDISTTAEAYAKAAYDASGAQAVTVNAYMGYDSVEPFARDASKGVFVLCKTSNKSADEVQALVVHQGGGTVYEAVARLCAAWDAKLHRNIGLVVGATDCAALGKVRAAAPELWILAPGVGFQGGDLQETCRLGVRASDGLGLLIPVSRAVSRAASPRQAAAKLRDDINKAREAGDKRARQEPPVAEYQRAFFDLAISCGVLKFGEFTLKSGRKSPYFFNAGLFNTGRAASALAACYAQTIHSSGLAYDVLFGPAYKGIPLVATVAAELYSRYGADKPFAYNRKEEKDHGEGGTLVGAPIGAGTRVLILDDVITAGTAVRESVALLQAKGAVVVGLVVAIDRQEVAAGESRSAVQAVEQELGLKVCSIVGLDSMLAWCNDSPQLVGGPGMLQRIVAYRNEFGVKL